MGVAEFTLNGPRRRIVPWSMSMPIGVRRGLLLAVLALLRAPSLPAQQPPEPLPRAPETRREKLFVREPETPEDLFEAVLITVKLGQPELAHQYLQQLLDSNPDNQTLFELRRKYGPRPFVRVAQVRELQPLGDTLMQRVNEASRAFARDPQRLAELVALLSASPTERAWAVQELDAAGSAAAPPLVELIRTAAQPNVQAAARYALRSLGRDVTPALIGTLETDDVRLKTRVIDLLVERGDREAVPFLWQPAASPESNPQVQQAARAAIARLTGKPFGSVTPTSALLAQARRYDAGDVVLPPAPDGSVELWHWDAAQARPVADSVPPQLASRVLATHFARQALELSPENQQAQLVFLTTVLARDAAAEAYGEPLRQGPGTAFDLALASGADLPAAVLRQAMAQRRHDVVLAATRVLAHVGSEALLYADDDRTPLLLQAIRYPERRVQFAAAEAILTMRPNRPFRGSSDVIAVLARAVRSRGEEKALVADSQLERGRRLAGLADQLGYATDVAVSGREAFRKAAASADFDLIMLDLNILRWELAETLANLKSDSRTAAIPVYLVGPLEWSSVAQRYGTRYEQVSYLVRPVASHDLAVQLQDEASDLPPLSSQQRLAYAQRAVQWLYAIASGQVQIGDARLAQDALQDALVQPELAADAVHVLALLSTPEAQRALADVTLDEQRPAEVRRSAAHGVCNAIRKFGVLLQPAQVDGLKQLHETTGDPELHAAVSAVLGCLGPDPAVTGQRLERYRAPTAPAAAADNSSDQSPAAPAQPPEQP